MKKLLKLTLFLFLIVFSLNVHSQSSEVKKLQDKIEEWKKYDFISYVINSDEQTIFSRYNNTGIISGVYSKWSSYSNSRRYEYIITPQFANGNYGATATRSITISTSYTKEGFELYKKSEIENVFKQIDEQIELEKNQEENRKATAQKNAERKRKRGDYVKKQIELIEHTKDSLLLEIDNDKIFLSDYIGHVKNLNASITNGRPELFNLINNVRMNEDFYSNDLDKYNKIDLFISLTNNTPVYNMPETIVDDEIFTILWMNGVETDRDTDTFNTHIPEKRRRFQNWYNDYGFPFLKLEYKDLSGNINKIYNLLNLLNESDKLDFSGETEFGFTLSEYLNLFKLIYITDEKTWNRVEKRLSYFFQPDDFKKSDERKYYSDKSWNESGGSERGYMGGGSRVNRESFHSVLYTWYRKSKYDAEKLGYDFDLVYPEKYNSFMINEYNLVINLSNVVFESDFLNENGDFEDRIITVLDNIESFIKTINEINKISECLHLLKGKTNVYGLNGGTGGFRKSKLKKILRDIDESTNQKEKSDFDKFIRVFMNDIYEIKNYKKPSSISEFKSKLNEIKILVDSGSNFPIGLISGILENYE